MNIDPAALESVLPARDIFPDLMPRYPNLWFFVEKSVALRRQYKYAVQLVVRNLEKQLRMIDNFQEDVENHALRHLLGIPAEGSDFQMRSGPYHPYSHKDPLIAHRHQVHARFYVTSLMNSGADQIQIPGGTGDYFAIAASAHYEVCTEDPAHPYVDSCPLCGITGEYDVEVRPESEDYCVRIHDPLGIEFMLHGTIRGQSYIESSPRPCTSLADLSRNVTAQRWEAVQFTPQELEPLTMGCVFVHSAQEAGANQSS